MTALAIQITPWLLLVALTTIAGRQVYLAARDIREYRRRRKLIRITVTDDGRTIADYTGNNPTAAAQLLRTTAGQLRPRSTAQETR